jgi:hypothetical protein
MSDQVRVLSGDDGPSPQRRWLTAVAAVLLALIAGLVVGRATAPDAGTTPRQAPPPATAAAQGPSRVVSGVGVGYPRTRAGAVAALFSDSSVLGDPRTLLDASRRSRVLSLIATDRYARTFRGRGAAALDQERRGPLGRGLQTGAQTVYLASPIAYRVVSFTPNAARVIGWGVAVVGNDQGLAPRATWATSTTDAVWENGDWKIDAVTSQDGPTPALTSSPSTASLFLDRLGGLQGVRHAP